MKEDWLYYKNEEDLIRDLLNDVEANAEYITDDTENDDIYHDWSNWLRKTMEQIKTTGENNER